MTDPVSQCRTFDLNTLARQDCRLAIERQAVEIFRDDDIGEQAGTGAAFLNRQFRCRRLDDRLASPAREFRPDMPDHLHPRRNFLQHLARILAQF